MSLVFDTGLSRSNRELIVGAVASKLAELRRPPAAESYLTAIVSLSRVAGGKSDEDFLIDLAKAVSGRVPCVAIATGACKSDNDGLEALETTDTLELAIYVVSGNQRGVVDGRLFADASAIADSTKDPGVFTILQHVTERIQGADLGIPSVHEPRKLDEDEVWSGDDVTVWGQTYRVAVTVTVNPDRNATTVMTSIEANHEGEGIPDASSLDPLVTTVTELDP